MFPTGVPPLVLLLALAGPGPAENPTPDPAEPTAPTVVDPNRVAAPAAAIVAPSERVRVEARPLGADDVAAFSTTLDTRQIARRGEDLGDVLRRVPGARVRDYGGLGSYATVSLRASTSEQVTILIDGVPQNRALGGPVDVSSVPATQVDQVTVFRGFAPAAYGLGGVGGLVDIRTRAPETDSQVQADLLAGQLDTQRLAAGLSARAAGGQLRIGAETLSSAGDFLYYDDNGTEFVPGDDRISRRTNNDVKQASFVARQLWDRAAGGRLSLGLRVQGRERGVPGKDSSRSESARLEESLGDLTGMWSWGLGGALDGVDLQFDGFRQSIGFEDRDSETQPRDQTTRLAGAGLAGILRASLGRHGLLVRGEVRGETARVRERLLAAQDRGGADRVLVAVTAEDIVGVGRWTIAPSLRWQHLSNAFVPGADGSSPAARDLREPALSGKLGVAFRVGRNLSVRGSMGRFQRYPSLLEMFGDRGPLIGNPDLRPERGDAFELGVDWRAERPRLGWRMELVGFRRDVQDLIWLMPNSQASSLPRNVASAEITGLESWLAFALPGWGLTFDVSGTLQRAEDTSGGFTDGKPLPYQPRLAGWLGLGWERSGFATRWEVSYVGENSTTQLDWPLFRVPERILHDWLVTYAWRNGLGLSVDVRNVLDRAVLDVAAFPLPGRVVFVGLGWHPGTRR